MTRLVIHTVARLALPHTERAAFSRIADALRGELYDIARAHGESVVVLATCERFEVYHTSGDSHVGARVAVASLEAFGAVVHGGADVVRHLFHVASGLGSRLTGETQVLGQVRAALNDAVAHGTISPGLRAVFSDALRCGRRVRERSALGILAPTYARRAVEALVRDGEVPRHVAVVGTGALARDVIRELHALGAAVTVIGRHAGRTQAVAAAFDVSWTTLDVLHTTATSFDALVVAVGAVAPVITPATLSLCSVPIIVDLGAAPTVDVDAAAVRVIDLEALGGAAIADATLAHAEVLVEREVARYHVARERSARVLALLAS